MPSASALIVLAASLLGPSSTHGTVSPDPGTAVGAKVAVSWVVEDTVLVARRPLQAGHILVADDVRIGLRRRWGPIVPGMGATVAVGRPPHWKRYNSNSFQGG